MPKRPPARPSTSPPHAATFLLAIMRHSKANGARLLGSIEIKRDNALVSGKQEALSSLGTQTVRKHMQNLNTARRQGIPTTLELCVMHERLLFLPAVGDERAELMDVLGNIYLERWQLTRLMKDLNQTVCVYEDAVRDDPPPEERALYLSDLGNAIHHRFERQDDLADLTRSLSVREASLALTPDGHRTNR
ncbi:hypothetical protein DFH09DRAFT_1328686 [Mycena vulgaris]|nr:hypothetical protein DFH09DRAFT_1328686 [Mycena vulgaris]